MNTSLRYTNQYTSVNENIGQSTVLLKKHRYGVHCKQTLSKESFLLHTYMYMHDIYFESLESSEVAQKLSNTAPYCFASFETEIMYFLTYYVS